MEFDPQVLSAIEDPYPVFDELREKYPLFHSAERDMWVVSRYEDVRAVLLDAETFASGMGTVPTGFVAVKPMMITQDGAYHEHLRTAVHLSLTPRRMRGLEGFIRKVTCELLDAIDPKAETDLFNALTDALPVAVITELLGIGFEDRAEFSEYAGAVIHAVEGEGPSAEEGIRWINAYLERMLAEREAQPGDDLVSRLLHPEHDGPQLTHDELVGFCSLLLMAGTETTTNALGNALALLHENPALGGAARGSPQGDRGVPATRVPGARALARDDTRRGDPRRKNPAERPYPHGLCSRKPRPARVPGGRQARPRTHPELALRLQLWSPLLSGNEPRPHRDADRPRGDAGTLSELPADSRLLGSPALRRGPGVLVSSLRGGALSGVAPPALPRCSVRLP